MSSKRLFREFLYVFILIILGTVLRLVQLGSLPAVLHRDETAIAYNAYSLLQTGRDEHGEAWPLNFRSFGDYKLPGLIYSTVLSVATWGLTPFAARFPTALAAIMTIPAVFWLTKEIGWNRRVALILAGLLTFDFWHIAQARNAYEPMVGLLFSVLGWACWLAGTRQPRYYFGALAAYVIGSLFYNIPFLLLPMLFMATWLIQNQWSWKKMRARATRPTRVALLAIVLAIVFLTYLMREVNASRSNTTVFSHPDILTMSARSVHAGLVGGLPSVISRTLNHPFAYSSMQVLSGYLSSFNPLYLFIEGDQNSWHNLRSIGLGNINPALLVFVAIGAYAVLHYGKTKQTQLSVLYLFLTPIVSSITIDAPITNRLLDFHLAVLLIAAIGVEYVWQNVKQNSKALKAKIILGLSACAYFGFFTLFIIRYWTMFNPLMARTWNPGLPALIQAVNQVADQYDTIYISSDLELGYTFFAFYTPFEPGSFQNNAQRYISGFDHVSRFDKYVFKKFPQLTDLNPENVAQVFDDQHQKFLIVERGEPPKTSEQDILWSYSDWSGNMLWYTHSLTLEQVVLSLEQMPPNTERIAVITYLKGCKKH